MEMLKVVDLVKTFEDIVAVDKLNLCIDEGEIYGLLGPNGAGKSTFIKLLTKTLRSDKGEIHIFGLDQGTNLLEIKSDLGIVPQDLAIYEDLTAEENVRFFASLYGSKGKILKENVNEALEFVGLTDRKKDYPKTFSGGMKRRLNIACALAHRPRLIILDEPTVGVDPQSRHKILSSIKRLNEQGTTIIYTSHYMEEIEGICTKVGIMDHGKLIAEGSVAELQNIVTDRNSLRIEIKDGTKMTDEILSQLKAIKGNINVLYSENILQVDSLKEMDNLEMILPILIDSNIRIKDVQINKINLETVFLSMTGRSLRD